MLETLRNKPEEYRRKFALGASTGIFLVMFFSWTYFNGYLGFLNFGGSTIVVSSDNSSQIATVSVKDNIKTTSPFENASNTFGGLFDEITRQYETVRDSVSSVLVPFVTNIDVYEKTK
jgi:hypothetical protein